MESAGYILRIATKQWADQVFSMAIYYTNLLRKWKPEQMILFIHKTSVGDAIVGYGVIERVYEKDELSEEEFAECEKYKWKKAIVFKYVLKFGKPLPIKETLFKSSKLHGRYLQGLSLTRTQLKSLMGQAELLQR